MKEKDGEFKVHNKCLQSFVFYYVQCELAYNDPPPIIIYVEYHTIIVNCKHSYLQFDVVYLTYFQFSNKQ